MYIENHKPQYKKDDVLSLYSFNVQFPVGLNSIVMARYRQLLVFFIFTNVNFGTRIRSIIS